MLWLLLGLLLVTPAAVPAAAVTARVHWQPSVSTGVVGYRVYSRVAGGAWGAPVDAGLPPAAGDGTLSVTVANLDPTLAYGFAVSAYRAGGLESAVSNELTLAAQVTTTTVTTSTTSTTRVTTSTTTTTTTRATTTTVAPSTTVTTTSRPPVSSTTVTTSSTSTTVVPGGTTSTTLPAECTVDEDCAASDVCHAARCDAGHCVDEPVVCPAAGPCTEGTCDLESGACGVEQLADGSACDAGDPCMGGTCTAGACTPPPADLGRARGSHFLSVSKLVLRAAGRARRFVAGASFAITDGVDPAVTGGTFELRSADGAVLYRATLPGRAFRSNKSRTTFKLIPSVARTVTGGITKFLVRSNGRTADVQAVGTSADLELAAAQRTLTWALHFGAECVRAPDLTCAAPQPTATSCN